MTDSVFAIIVAGGKGLRMGGALPKQFMPLAGRPVLMRTVECLRRAFDWAQIVVVLPADQQELWQRLCRDNGFGADCMLATGGATRFHSVAAGLAALPADTKGVVAVHDGVRPLVAPEVVRACCATARQTGAAVPVVPVVETLRHVSEGTVPRADYRLVQTPQCFDIDLLRKAYAQDYRDSFTDDASVVEALGHAVTLVDGNRENIKLTTPADMAVAEALLGNRA